MSELLSSDMSGPLRVAAGADRFGEQRGLGISTVAFKVTAPNPDGLFILENTFLAKGGPSRHLHYDQDEWFYILEGEFHMTSVVLPAMVTELGTSGLLALVRPAWLSPSLLLAGFACAVLTWAVTFFVSVPLHDTLSRGFDPTAISRIVATNWLRTAFWTAHALLLLLQVWRVLPKTSP